MGRPAGAAPGSGRAGRGYPVRRHGDHLDEDVLHVARLARLPLTDDEVARTAEQLSAILGHVEALVQLDLAGVPPTAHVLEVENVARPDVPRPCWPRDEVLEGAPDAQDGMFRVPPTSRNVETLRADRRALRRAARRARGLVP